MFFFQTYNKNKDLSTLKVYFFFQNLKLWLRVWTGRHGNADLDDNWLVPTATVL